MKKLLWGIAAAALLWFYMFSPWTEGIGNFWVNMSISALILTAISLYGLGPGTFREMPRADIGECCIQAASGIVLAFVLWGVFFLGDYLSGIMFSFAGEQVDRVYGMKEGASPAVIALLLLFLIGPAEEFFWRGYVQKTIGETVGKTPALFITTIIYALVHIWSFNFMLIMAALVAGGFWGLIYRLKPSLLPALIVSHAIWDALVFIFLPI